LVLVLTATIIQIIIGVIAGLYAGVKRGKTLDLSVTGLGLLMYAMPSFLLLLFFRYIFADKLQWFPVIGVILVPSADPLQYFGQFMYRMALPLITLVCMGFGSWAFYTRNLSVNVLTQDFIQTARATGVEDRKLTFKYVFRAIMPPVITLVVISLPRTIFGSIVTEYIFTWKGIGWWYLWSINAGDYPAVQSLFFIYTILLLGGNLLADILYGYLDPRIRVGIRR
jgi:peptide/nickel transport system permease protein